MDALVKVPFQAVAIRYVHDTWTGEFLNIGVVVLCEARAFADASFLPSWTRVTAAFPGADLVHLRRYRDALQEACAVWASRQAELFRPSDGVHAFVRGVIPDESGIELSNVISGVTADPERTASEIFQRYVGRYVVRDEPASRTDDDVWKTFTHRLRAEDVLRKLQPRTLLSHRFPSFRLELDHAWKNGMWNAAEPVSFDLTSARAIQQKAAAIMTHMDVVRPREQDTAVTLVIGMPRPQAPSSANRAAEDGFELLRVRLVGEVNVIRETEAEQLAEKMVNDIRSHSSETPST